MKKVLATLVLGLGIAGLLPAGCGLPATASATPAAPVLPVGAV